ncbi:MAG TPA: DMT family transporter [Candidatus Dormibacteraeota bacterium]|nr:DMT family transporter [Candidatus Dormibacteraeota bacterium]
MRGLARVDPLHARGAAMALGSAILWGASTPFSKILLRRTGPLILAALLYLGAGLALVVVLALRRRSPSDGAAEAALRASDLPLLAAATFCGAILGPSLMMFGLLRVSAVTGSLLLNLEPPLTILLAIVWFREHLGRRQAGAAALILAGTVLVGYRPGELASQWSGIVAVALACLAWAIDTNLNQRLSLRDPVALAGVKGLLGGFSILAVALLAGEARPSPGVLATGLALGTITYGVSMVLFFRALRQLGTARVAAYFATGPFVGALTSVVVLDETLRGLDLAAMGLMAAGLVMLLRETHAHEHVHEVMEHDHAHTHDEHHDHAHEPGVSTAGRHAHPHRHAPLVHAHPHTPDLHHRHRHD